MNKNQVCKILGVSKGHLYNVYQGRRSSPLKAKIQFLLAFEDTLEAIIRQDSFGELCDLVIKRAIPKKEYHSVNLALNGRSLRNFILNDFDKNDVEQSVMIMFDRESFMDKKMEQFINDENLENMCDIAMRCTRNPSIRKMCSTLKLIYQEFWQVKIKSSD